MGYSNHYPIYKGDVLKAPQNIIVHQVNCMGVMGGGVASQVKQKYPDVFSSYFQLVAQNRGHEHKLLGKSQLLYIGSNKYIANLFGQYTYGLEKRQTNYEAFYRALEELKEQTICQATGDKPNLSFAFPFLIGSDRGGADWNVIDAMIYSVFQDNFEVAYWDFCI